MTTAVVTKSDVEKLLTICGDARACYMHYRALFEPGNPHHAVFSTTAPVFFGDINLMFVKYLILEVCKLGDPARDLSAPAQFDELKHRATKLQYFIAKLKPARDKLLSHWDRSTVVSSTGGLGAADTDEWVHFWLDLQGFVAVLCERYLGERVFFCGGANSDAGILIDALRQSIR
jgi:hypothetical protein